MNHDTQPIADLMDESISKLKATLTKPETMKETILTAIEVNGPLKRKELLIQVNDWIEMFSTEGKITDRKMRRLIMELIADGHAIASSEKGYSIINNVRQLAEAVEYLKAKARAISIRGNTLIGNYDLRYQNAPANLQFRLF